jgi:hypothetical protein
MEAATDLRTCREYRHPFAAFILVYHLAMFPKLSLVVVGVLATVALAAVDSISEEECLAAVDSLSEKEYLATVDSISEEECPANDDSLPQEECLQLFRRLRHNSMDEKSVVSCLRLWGS